MSASPDWLRALASTDGTELPPTMSIRPALAGHLAAARAQWLKRRSATPLQAPQVDRVGKDARRLADVLDPVNDGEKPYVLLGRIGSGGMGVVHLARQRSTGREVAIKAVHPEKATDGYLDAFRQECLTTAAVEHPHIVPVYDAGLDFMVMKRLAGNSLEYHLHRPEVPLTAHIEVMIKVCDAVAYAHSRGVVHRDLKGENIFVGSFGEVWVMDWGLAAAFSPSPEGRWLAPSIADAQGMCAGTPMCVPPEVATGDLSRIGATIDLFLLGGLLYRVLSGHYPYEAKTSQDSLKMAARRDFPPLLVRAPSAPFRLVQAAERATAWDADDRGSVHEFANDLRTWLHTSGASNEAHMLLKRAGAHLAIGERETASEARYRSLAAAISEAQRALALCPELRGAHELVARARTAFAQAAEQAGDRNLARMVLQGFVPPTEPSGAQRVIGG
jgi:serine/threonine protein kinase